MVAIEGRKQSEKMHLLVVDCDAAQLTKLANRLGQHFRDWIRA